jgi:hypothetical protein
MKMRIGSIDKASKGKEATQVRRLIKFLEVEAFDLWSRRIQLLGVEVTEMFMKTVIPVYHPSKNYGRPKTTR